ncbi:MAG: DUF3108 domain-containing protein, partial [Acidobacteriota bacterium]|nr:DUF3108 domain-containing protein [Acidobacteriota bacterium]
GEAHMRARHSTSTRPPNSPQWDFNFTIDASLPGYQVLDRYTSTTGGDLCSDRFDRVFTHGNKKSDERTVIDTATGRATRTTASGGKTEIPVSGCIRDALAFLYYARRELGQGKVPPSQTILFGSAYQARLEYTGAQTIPVNDLPTQADRVVCNFKGPASNLKIEMFFARDAARTPLLVRAPFAIGNFTMELLR